MTTLTTELITTEAGLVAMRPAWTALWHRTPHATPFQSPDWLLPWWRQFGTGAPLVALLLNQGELIGVLPLYVLDEPPERKLLPIGAGITDYQDALLAPGAPADAATVLLHAALAAADGITGCDLIDLPPDAALRRAAAPSGWGAAWRAADPCPVLTLPADAAGLSAVIPAATLRNYRINCNRIDRAGDVRLETATAATLPDLLEALFRLHESRWNGRGVLGDDRVRAFHRDAAPLLLAAGMLRLQVLRLDGAVIAAIHALAACDGRLCCYLSGYDRAFSRQGPGSVLLGAVVEQAIRDGCNELHFLRGGERYKYDWGGVDRMNAACRLTPI